MPINFETAVSTIRNYIYNSSSPASLSYINGYNSPHNVKRFILLKTLVGVEYHLVDTRTSKRFVAKQAKKKDNEDTFEIVSVDSVRSPLTALIKPAVCSDIEEVLVDVSYIKGYSSVQEMFLDKLHENVKNIFNRFPRLRNVYVVNIGDDMNFWNVFKSGNVGDKPLSSFLKQYNIQYSAWSTNNTTWYSSWYLRDGLSVTEGTGTIYKFDSKLRDYFTKKRDVYQARIDADTVKTIDKTASADIVRDFFNKNVEYYSRLANMIDSGDVSIQQVKAHMENVYKRLELSQKGLAPDTFKEMGEPFTKIHTTLSRGILQECEITTLESAKQNLEIVKGINNDISLTSKLVEYTILCGRLMSLCGTFVLEKGMEQSAINHIKNNFGLDISELIQVKVVETVAKIYQTTEVREAVTEINPDKVQIFMRVFTIESLTLSKITNNNIDKFINSLKYLIEFVNSIENWALVMSTQRDAYYILVNNGFKLLDEDDTKLFYRPLTRPLTKVDMGYMYDVPADYKPTLRRNIENGVAFYYNPDFEQCELGEDRGIGFDTTSLKIMYKEFNTNTVEFYFLLPFPARVYTEITGNSETMLSDGLKSAFVDFMKRTGVDFTSIANKSTVAKFPETVLRITTLKSDFANLPLLMSDILDKKGAFASMNIEVGNLNKILAGFTPQGPHYFDSEDFGNNSFLVGGGTGSGKTVTCWEIIIQLIMNGIPLITLDAKEAEGAELANNIGFLGFSGNSSIPVKYFNNRSKKYEEQEGIPEYAIGASFMQHYYYFKSKWFKQQADMHGLEFKGALDYLKNPNYRGLIDINYSLFFVDEMETMVDSSVGKDVLRRISSLASGVRTTGIWRLYATQTPTQKDMGKLTTNITNFLIGKRLTSNIVTSSLKLDWSSDIMRIVDPQADQTGIAEIDNNPIPRGLFALYEGRGNKPKLLKSLYVPECEHSQTLINFLNKYCPQQYAEAKRFLWTMVSRMFNSGYLEEVGAEDIIDFFEKKGLTNKLIATESNETYSLHKTPSNSFNDNIEVGDKMGFGKDYDELGDDTVIEEYEDIDEDYEGDYEEYTDEPVAEQTENVRQQPTSAFDRPMFHNAINKNIDAPDEVKSGDGVDMSKRKVIHANITIGKGLYSNGSNLLGSITNNEACYNMMFRSITKIILNAIQQNYGGLSRVMTLEFVNGQILVNRTILQLNCKDLSNIKNPAILREIQDGNWADLFDFDQLTHFKNLGVLSFGSYDYVLKLKADLNVDKFSQIFKKFHRLEQIVIVGETISRSSQLETTPNMKLLEQTNTRSDEIARSGMGVVRGIPSRFRSIKRFYQDKNVSKTKKIAYTVGGTAMVGLSAYLGATLGFIVLPWLVLYKGIKSVKE